jgi:Family of unknown function (DUF5522)
MSNCNDCGITFSCSSNLDCWCNQYPKLFTIALLSLQEDVKICLCENCLSAKLKVEVEKISFALTPEDALNNNPYKNLPKSKDLFQGIDYYEENGFFVFTKWHHIKRGYCCKNNCRHCAYS